MGLVSFVLTLPLAPVRGVLSLARVIEQRAEEELYDPARVRRRLEEIEEAVAAGEMGRHEAERAQERILEPVVAPVSPGGAAEAGSDSEAGASSEAGAGREPESEGGGPEPAATGSDFVTVRGEDAAEDDGGHDAADERDGGVDADRDATGNDFVTLRGGDREAGQEPDPSPET